MEVQAGSKGMNGGGAPGDTLLNYELYGNLREADGGERYRSVCAQCYGRLSSALADWGTRDAWVERGVGFGAGGRGGDPRFWRGKGADGVYALRIYVDDVA